MHSNTGSNQAKPGHYPFTVREQIEGVAKEMQEGTKCQIVRLVFRTLNSRSSFHPHTHTLVSPSYTYRISCHHMNSVSTHQCISGRCTRAKFFMCVFQLIAFSSWSSQCKARTGKHQLFFRNGQMMKPTLEDGVRGHPFVTLLQLDFVTTKNIFLLTAKRK